MDRPASPPRQHDNVVNWHWIFALVMVPGIVAGVLLHKVLRNTDASAAAEHTLTHDATEHKWTDVFKSRNVPLNVVGMLCWLTCLVVLGAFLPNYLLDHLGLDMQQMGYVLSAIGFGGAVGTIVLPSLSDRIGRKPVMILAVIGALVSLYFLTITGADTSRLFMTVFFDFGLICLTVGPTTTESVPAKLMATATGIVVGIGEIFGGGVAPGIAGYIAKNHGIEHVLNVALVAMAIGLVVVVSIRETLMVRAEKPAVAI